MQNKFYKQEEFYSGDVLAHASKIIKNPEVLKDNFIPDRFLFRDEERKRIEGEISTFFHLNTKPDDIFIYGPPSTGKTHMIKNIQSRINKFAEEYDHKIKLLYTSFKNVTYIDGLARLVGIKPKGITHMEIIEKLNRKIKDYIIGVIFDEVDKVVATQRYNNPIDILIGTFTRLHELIDNPNIFIIIISNKDIKDYLSSSSRSTFNPFHVHFRDYKTEEIYEILRDRCEKAFCDGVMDDDTLSYLVSKLGRVRDLRLGLKTLLMAGKITYSTWQTKITPDIIDEAFEQVQKNIIRDRIVNADDTQLLIIYYTALLQNKDDIPFMTKIYELYKKEAVNPLSFGYISNYVVPKLEEQGLIMSEVKGLGRGKGKARFLWVDKDIKDDVLNFCKEELEIRGVIE